ncbi:MAG: ChbG/HpnK family deacetylase, partial [Pseudomonadota bacterium]
HLCLTSGTPVSDKMKRCVRWFGGRFPRKELMSGALLTRAVTVADVRDEWRQQIETCLEYDLDPVFLNSHEHLHMWPSLFSLIHELARDYGIRHVRFPRGEASEELAVGTVARNLVLNGLGRVNGGQSGAGAIPCLGFGESGNLSFAYLQRLVGKLERGASYELMCHPGYFEPTEVEDRRLQRYHNWEGELSVLTSDATADLFAGHGVRPIGYRDLPTFSDADRLVQ